MARKPHLALGMDSYRGRYLWISLLLSVGLLSAAYIGQRLVEQSTERSTFKTQQRAAAGAALNDVSESLHQLHTWMQRFALDPSETDAAQIRLAKRYSDTSIRRLTRLLRIYDSAQLAGIPENLTQDSQELEDAVNELIQMRLDTARWLPGGSTMREQMLPSNLRLRTHLQTLTAELEADSQAHDKAQVLLYDWSGVVGEARLLVSNRFGVFDPDSRAAMQARIANIESYLDTVNTDLEALRSTVEPLDDELLESELAEIAEAYALWLGGYRQLVELIGRDDWRRDLPLLDNQIKPVLARMHQRISASRLQLHTDGEQGLRQVLAESADLASAITATAGMLIIVLLIAYLSFERWLLRPIAQIAEQMKQEARGDSPSSLTTPPVAETRTLVQAFQQMHRQISHRQKRLDHMAHHDPLTGLPNRVLFREQLEETLAISLPAERRVAVLFLDLDRFKDINDSHGHLVGDQLLVQVAERLRSVFRGGDTVARLSGDEFAVLLPDCGARSELDTLAGKVVEVMQPAFEIEGITYRSSASIGVAVAPRDGREADRLIQHADAAMYHAKAAGRAGFSHFEFEMVETSAAQLALDTELRDAIDKQQLRVYLQPVINLSSGETHAYECLLRWQHPEHGLLTPGSFLANLDDMSLLRNITDWVLEQIGKAQARSDIAIALNLPARLLLEEGFAHSLEQQLQNGNLKPAKLIVEITEDTLTQDLHNAAVRLTALRKLGVRLALDDFGTGQSSLSHLRSLPFDLLKIDRTFVQGVLNNDQDAALVKAMLLLAHTLGIRVVGEGVESPEQLQFLKDHNCEYGQGYLLGTPAPIERAVPPDAQATQPQEEAG